MGYSIINADLTFAGAEKAADTDSIDEGGGQDRLDEDNVNCRHKTKQKVAKPLDLSGEAEVQGERPRGPRIKKDGHTKRRIIRRVIEPAV